MNRKAQFLDKRKKSCLCASDVLVGAFCKGWGASAKQGGVDLQGCGQIAKVGTNRKGCGANAKGAVQTQRPPSKRKGGAETQKDSRSCPDAIRY